MLITINDMNEYRFPLYKYAHEHNPLKLFRVIRHGDLHTWMNFLHVFSIMALYKISNENKVLKH